METVAYLVPIQKKEDSSPTGTVSILLSEPFFEGKELEFVRFFLLALLKNKIITVEGIGEGAFIEPGEQLLTIHFSASVWKNHSEQYNITDQKIELLVNPVKKIRFDAFFASELVKQNRISITEVIEDGAIDWDHHEQIHLNFRGTLMPADLPDTKENEQKQLAKITKPSQGLSPR